ncbi:SPASM domain-containing protein [Nocardia lasii]|uniref:SPASM domain-containing protein n=1 Tax=Nocardia lasii TaxID=1616107 RepID=A0ABW1JMG9_9NOCA
MQIEGPLTGCGYPVHHASFSVGGDLFLCCNDYYQRERFGNITDGSIHELMTSDAAITARRKVFGVAVAEDDFVRRRCHNQTHRRLVNPAAGVVEVADEVAADAGLVVFGGVEAAPFLGSGDLVVEVFEPVEEDRDRGWDRGEFCEVAEPVGSYPDRGEVADEPDVVAVAAVVEPGGQVVEPIVAVRHPGVGEDRRLGGGPVGFRSSTVLAARRCRCRAGGVDGELMNVSCREVFSVLAKAGKYLISTVSPVRETSVDALNGRRCRVLGLEGRFGDAGLQGLDEPIEFLDEVGKVVLARWVRGRRCHRVPFGSA